MKMQRAAGVGQSQKAVDWILKKKNKAIEKQNMQNKNRKQTSEEKQTAI